MAKAPLESHLKFDFWLKRFVRRASGILYLIKIVKLVKRSVCFEGGVFEALKVFCC